ncbi:MAG: ModE family transcriptional regulator [Bacteroidota bacterium]
MSLKSTTNKSPKSLKKMPTAIKAEGRIWIETSEGKLVGKGRIELMEKINEFGSIRQAAAAMKMSYRQAWQLIDEVNTRGKTPMVISQRGGKGGGQAIVTEKGHEVIALYKALNNRFQKFLAKEAEKFNF